MIVVLGGAAFRMATAPAQRTEQLKRIGVLMGTGRNDPESQRRLNAFLSIDRVRDGGARNS